MLPAGVVVPLGAEGEEGSVEATPTEDANRSCCWVPLEAAGSASLRRKTLADVMVVKLWLVSSWAKSEKSKNPLKRIDGEILIADSLHISMPFIGRLKHC